MAKRAKVTVNTPPPDYSELLAAELCAVVATGMALDRACALVGRGLAPDVVYLWMFRSPEFVVTFREAKRAAMFKYLEDTIDIADDASGDTYEALTKDGDTYDAPNSANVNRSKLKVQARQWAMTAMNREVFGEPPRGASGGDGDNSVSLIVIAGGLPDA